MIGRMLKTKKFLIGSVLGAVLGAGILVGCADDPNEGRSGGESAGEHGSAGEGGTEGGGESGGGGEEGSAAMLAPDQIFDAVRGGAQLVMGYDSTNNSFTGTVANTTNGPLTRVRIEVHLDNGTELGPTTPADLAPGEVMAVNLPSTQASFTGWVAHAEVGGGEGGGEHGGSGGESGSEGAEGADGESGSEGAGGEGGSESAGGESGVELNEAAMSSPVVPLNQTWDGTLGPLAVSAWYDQATQTVHSTVQNTSSQTQCYVQAEPHLKSGTTTVGELGPDKLGDLAPGQQATTSVALATEPALAGVAFDGYVVHMEVFDCAGPGPQPHTAEGGGAEGAGGEGHGAGGEGGSESGTEGAESGGGGEEGSGANALALDATFDQTRNGARLVMAYDPATNTFNGTVINTTNNTLTRARVEVHLTNGVELGPTTPVNLAPGQSVAINLDVTQASFTGWTPHVEVGSGEGGGSGTEGAGEHGGSGGESGSEGGGESGYDSGTEGAGEHGGSGGESGSG